MSLITIKEEVSEHLVADAAFKPENVLPFIPAAKNEIINILGKAQYEELLDYYESESTGVDELDALLPVVQRPLFYFAFLKGLDNFNVSIGNNGIAVVSNSTLAPASTARVEKLRESLNTLAYDSLEDLLLFLENNINDYTLWSESDAYAFQHQFLIFSANTFDQYFHIERSRLTYLKWRSTMYDKEIIHVTPKVSAEYLQELKEQIATGTLTASNLKVLKLLQRGLAYLTAAEYTDKKYHNNGMRFLVMAKNLMDQTPDDYPTYKASSVYDEMVTSHEPYENEEENNLAVFGG